MDTRKRSRSYSEEANDRPTKAIKEEIITAAPDALAAAQARIMELEAQVKEHQDFLERVGLGRGIPVTSRYDLGNGPRALTARATRIGNDAYRVYWNACEGISYTYASGSVSDHLSLAMLYFLNEANKLSNIQGSAGIVFGLVVQLGNLSNEQLGYDELAIYGDRPSDQIVDNMLQGLALPRYHEDPDWDFLSVLEALKEKADSLDEVGIKDDCVRTIAELTSWKAEPPADSALAMDVDK